MCLRISGRMKTAIQLLAAMGFAVSAWGQADLSGWPRVRIEVLALDARGDLSTGLTPDILSLKEDGKAQMIAEVKPAAEAQSVCLLIDASGSMWAREAAAQYAAARLLRSLPAEDEVCVADFSSKAYLDQDLTLDRKKDEKALGFIKDSGGTALRTALVAISDYLRKKAQNRSRAIILLSDGTDNASPADEAQMKRSMLVDGGVAVHVMCVPADPARAAQARSDTNEKVALRLTNMFGGLTYFPRNTADMNAAVDHLADAMKTRYVLTYEASNSAKDGRERKIEVAFAKALQNQRAVVRAPEGYYAPSQ